MAQKDQVPLDTASGLDRHPKRVKEEEEPDMYPKRRKVLPPANASPGKGGENGLSPPAASEEGLVMDHRVGCGPSAPAFGICREMPHWCLECGKSFAQKAELEKHGLSHAGQCSYICGDCGRNLVEHISLAAGQGGACLAGNASNHASCRKRVPPLSSETAAPRKERKELSLQEKVRVLEMLEGPKVSQSELAKRFGVSQPQICRIIKNKERILAEWCKNGDPGRKRKLEEKAAAGEVALLQWFEHRCVPSAPANGMHWQEKAGDLSKMFGRKPELEAVGLGWLCGFKARQKAAHGRPPEENGEELEDEGWESNVLPYILNKYDPRDIYACGEAGILFRATPEGLAWDSGEGAKDQLTVLLCTNLDASDKRDALIIGKARRPFGFQGVGREDLLPATYRADSKAWMTAAIFTEWLHKFNEEMRRAERNVVLFLVPCTAHPDTELSHTKMVFMPPGSSRSHPIEHGLVQNFKCHYRRRMLLRLLAVLDSRSPVPASELSKHLTLLDAVHMIIQAWLDVCPQTITSCFQAAGFGLALRIPTPPADVVRALGFKDRQQFEQFVLVDEELDCFGDREGAEMLQEVREPACATAEEEKAEDLPCPSKADVMESLATLRRYFECHSVSSAVFQTFYKLEDVVHGMSLANMQVLRAKALNEEGL